MRIDRDLLQKVVDKMTVPVSGGGWRIDHTYAPAFFNLIDGYIRKAAYKSDRYDPENTFAETRWQVWRALERYGPRPNGRLFAEYTLKLKTNNCLTNLYKKRQSYKARINYRSESIEKLEELTRLGEIPSKLPACPPIDCVELGEKIYTLRKKNEEERKVRGMIKKITKLDIDRKKDILYALTCDLAGSDDCLVETIYKNFVNRLTELRESLYNDQKAVCTLDWEVAMASQENIVNDVDAVDVDKVKIGDQFITKAGGKFVEIKGKTDKGFRIMILATRKEVEAPFDYIEHRLIPREALDLDEENEDLVDATVEKDDEEPAQEATVEVDKKKMEELLECAQDKPVDTPPVVEESVETSKKIIKKGKKMTAREGSKKALVIKLLQEGPQTRTSLAEAIIKAKIGKNCDVEREKNYVSIILYGLTKKDKLPLKTISRGKYVLESD